MLVHNPEVEARWLSVRAEVESALDGRTEVIARVPGWEPTDLATALHWLQMHVYEGFHVSFLVDRETLWLKEWEFGDDEPTWDEVKATPISPPHPSQDIW